MAGLFYAAELKRRAPGAEVHLVESAPTLGGTYGSLRYPGDRILDYGMHLFYEACDERVDRVVREVLPDSEWHFWEGNRKDIAGLYWRGRLQHGSNYVDLRETPEREHLLAGLFSNLADDRWKAARDCDAYFRQKFGAPLTDGVLAPAQRKVWRTEPSELDPFAIRMVSCDRVVAFDHELMLDLMKSEALRSRLGVPEQLRLPPGIRTSPQRALYPRKPWLSHYIDRFTQRLERAGVAIHTSTRIENIAAAEGGRVTLRLKGPDGASRTSTHDHVFWAAPLMQLPATIGFAIDDLPMDAPHHIGYAHFVLDRAPDMGELYYFYCYDAPYRAFRVTNYAAYCPASAADGYAVCVEMQYPGSEKLPEPATIVEDARKELASMGVVVPANGERFAGAHASRFGFPRPTLRNREAFAKIRVRIVERIPHGLVLGGIAPDLGRFFLQDILSGEADQLDQVLQ